MLAEQGSSPPKHPHMEAHSQQMKLHSTNTGNNTQRGKTVELAQTVGILFSVGGVLPLLGGVVFPSPFCVVLPSFLSFGFPPLICWVVPAGCPFFLGSGFAFSFLLDVRRTREGTVPTPTPAGRSTRPQKRRSNGNPRPRRKAIWFPPLLLFWVALPFRSSFSFPFVVGSGNDQEGRPTPSPEKEGRTADPLPTQGKEKEGNPRTKEEVEGTLGCSMLFRKKEDWHFYKRKFDSLIF